MIDLIDKNICIACVIGQIKSRKLYQLGGKYNLSQAEIIIYFNAIIITCSQMWNKKVNLQ